MPTDGTCVQISAAGYRTVTRAFDAAAGAMVTRTMSGLPLGQVTFTAQAFSGACPPSADAVPTWITDAPFTATVAVAPPVLVTLNLIHNGNATVVVGFDDSADASSVGGSTGSDGGTTTTPPPGATSAAFMNVPNVTGDSQDPDFPGWFALQSFSVGLTTATGGGAGTGAGAGKTTWAATAVLRYQKGAPDLYSLAAQGKNIATVAFATEQLAKPKHVVWKTTLKNAIVKSVQTGPAGGDEIPVLSVSFQFQQIEIEHDAVDAAGGPGTATKITWNTATNMGAGGTRAPLAFEVGGVATPPFLAASGFRAPSQTTPTTFSDASVTYPLDATALNLALEEASGQVLPTGTVELFDGDPAGPALVGTYGFRNVLLTGLTLSGLDATVSFTAASRSWTVGDETTTAP
ncbi:MAG TPA: type VI secretion system tube protein Hcp [Polyangia bacterium]|nr:type VI secretion system tube protein Hcp [Polyangia bacterium]